MLIYLLFAMASLTKGAVYHISSCPSTYSNASKLCSLATPHLTFPGTQPTVTVRAGVNSTLWVGYTRALTTFFYRGCTTHDTVKYYMSDLPYRRDPGYCYSVCKTILVGLGRTSGNDGTEHCYCITSNITDLSEKECDFNCHEPMSTLCGGISKTGHKGRVSIYEKVSNLTTKDNASESQKCLAYEPSSKEFVWKVCTAYYLILCLHKNGSLIYHPGSSSINGNWTFSMMWCLGHDHEYVRVDTNLSLIEGSISPLWIGIIRSYSIVTSTERLAAAHTQQGYIEVNDTDNGLFELKFTNEESEFHALCTGNNDVSPCSSASPSTVPTTIYPNTGITSTAANNTEDPDTAIQNQGENQPGLVYIVIPLVLAAAVGFLVWRKRKSNPNKSADSKVTNGNGPNTDLNTKGLPEQGAVMESEADTVRHDYFMLEPVNEYAAIDDTNRDQNDDGEYDTTKGAMENATGGDSGNIYNRLEDVAEDTYNHNYVLTIRDIDTYGNPQNDATYNTASLDGYFSKPDNVDDTYNHIDGAVSNQEHEV